MCLLEPCHWLAPCQLADRAFDAQRSRAVGRMGRLGFTLLKLPLEDLTKQHEREPQNHEAQPQMFNDFEQSPRVPWENIPTPIHFSNIWRQPAKMLKMSILNVILAIYGPSTQHTENDAPETHSGNMWAQAAKMLKMNIRAGKAVRLHTFETPSQGF